MLLLGACLGMRAWFDKLELWEDVILTTTADRDQFKIIKWGNQRLINARQQSYFPSEARTQLSSAKTKSGSLFLKCFDFCEH